MRNPFGDTVSDRDAGHRVTAARMPVSEIVQISVRLDVTAILPHFHIDKYEYVWR
jgi:hypothetical protein